MAKNNILESREVAELAQLVEESTRSNREGVKYFLEPALGVLARAKSKRHHIIFGRRGSGKSSLLRKTESDLSAKRIPVVVVDLEGFKGHSYPDVLLSVLIKTFAEYKKWLETAAIYPASKSSFWQRFGQVPLIKPLKQDVTGQVIKSLEESLLELNRLLNAPEEVDKTDTTENAASGSIKGLVGVKTVAEASLETAASLSSTDKSQSSYKSKKIEALHRNIIKYKDIVSRICDMGEGSAYLLLDDLYHIRIADQPEVIDYFHRIAKDTGLWLKVGTIKHRSRWYVAGNPPVGMKIADDADAIDLDITLEKYDLTKRFLLKILEQFAQEKKLNLNEILTDGAKDRLVLASGGVARDFLTIFRRGIEVASARIASAGPSAGAKIIAEDINIAAGEHDSNKREEFNRDTTPEDQQDLTDFLNDISDFCLKQNDANCILVDKEIKGKEERLVGELVDLKFLHHVKSRVTVRGQSRKIYDAYMLDVSQYTGQRKRQNFEMIKFWGPDSADALRKTKLIFR